MLKTYTPVIQEYVSGVFITLILHWKNNSIIYINLQWTTTNTPNKASSALGKELKEYIVSYEKKAPLPCISLPLAWDIIPQDSFQKKVLCDLSKLPYGTIITYSSLAKQAGRPCAARAVGSIMSKNPWPFIIPCHRVIARDGNLTGFSGDGGLPMKKWLLCHEGYTVSEKKHTYIIQKPI